MEPATLTTKTMTPTQWLAIPTEISLADFPKIINSQADGVDMQAVFINGKSYVIKQEEEEEKLEVKEESVSGGPTGVYLYSMGNGLLATSENVAQALTIECTPDTSIGKYPTSPVSSTTPDIVILKSKPKNPDYKVKNKTLATKRSRPVSMKLVRARPGLRIKIWMSYQGHIFADEPVKRCKKHDECVWCGDHEFNQGFCVISKFHHYETNDKGQPLAILAPTLEHLDKEGGTPFSIVFSCWNSCDVHSKFGKELAFTMEIIDEGNSVVRSMEFSLQCCQNLLRDAFKDRKRKQLVATENGEEESMAKSACIGDGTQSMASPPPPPHPSVPVLKREKSVDVVVEGLDEEKRDIIERMVRVMGGVTYRIPHLNRIRPTRKDHTKTEVKCNAATANHMPSDILSGDTADPSIEFKGSAVCVSVSDPSISQNSNAIFTSAPDHITDPVSSSPTPTLASDSVTAHTTSSTLFVGHNGGLYTTSTRSAIPKHINTVVHSVPTTCTEPLTTVKLKPHLTAKATPLVSTSTHRIVLHASCTSPTTITTPRVAKATSLAATKATSLATTKATSLLASKATSLLATKATSPAATKATSLTATKAASLPSTTTSTCRMPVTLGSIRAVSPSQTKSTVISAALHGASNRTEPQTIHVKIEKPWL